MPADAGTDELGQKVMEVIARTQRIPQESVAPESTFEQLKIDSLDGINIVFELEKEFNIDIPDEGVATLRSVQETIDGVRQLVEQKRATAQSGAI
jgi:acyl carrier protein